MFNAPKLVLTNAKNQTHTFTSKRRNNHHNKTCAAPSPSPHLAPDEETPSHCAPTDHKMPRSTRSRRRTAAADTAQAANVPDEIADMEGDMPPNEAAGDGAELHDDSTENTYGDEGAAEEGAETAGDAGSPPPAAEGQNAAAAGPRAGNEAELLAAGDEAMPSEAEVTVPAPAPPAGTEGAPGLPAAPAATANNPRAAAPTATAAQGPPSPPADADATDTGPDPGILLSASPHSAGTQCRRSRKGTAARRRAHDWRATRSYCDDTCRYLIMPAGRPMRPPPRPRYG